MTLQFPLTRVIALIRSDAWTISLVRLIRTPRVASGHVAACYPIGWRVSCHCYAVPIYQMLIIGLQESYSGV